MSLRKLPEIRADARLHAAQFDVRPDALEKWQPEIRAAETGDASISILESIGEGWDGAGVTAKRIGAALRAIGNRDVRVDINSPGGDFFEGVAIYNQLRAHPAKVTVNVMGLAASAASVIAMAGDEINMGDGAFLMIHNAWAFAIGNRHDLADAATLLEPFDAAMAQVYATRAGITAEAAAALMDAETWMGAQQAVDAGFADGLLAAGAVAQASAAASDGQRAKAMIDTALAKAGYGRAQRREAFAHLFADKPSAAGTPGMPGAASNTAMPGAGDTDAAATLQSLIAGLSG